MFSSLHLLWQTTHYRQQRSPIFRYFFGRGFICRPGILFFPSVWGREGAITTAQSFMSVLCPRISPHLGFPQSLSLIALKFPRGHFQSLKWGRLKGYTLAFTHRRYIWYRKQPRGVCSSFLQFFLEEIFHLLNFNEVKGRGTGARLCCPRSVFVLLMGSRRVGILLFHQGWGIGLCFLFFFRPQSKPGRILHIGPLTNKANKVVMSEFKSHQRRSIFASFILSFILLFVEKQESIWILHEPRVRENQFRIIQLQFLKSCHEIWIAKLVTANLIKPTFLRIRAFWPNKEKFPREASLHLGNVSRRVL